MKFKILLSIIIFSTFLILSSKSALAFSFNDFTNGVKSLFGFSKDNNIKEKAFTINSEITLAANGDENNNGVIDSGDIVRFSYTLTNTTDKEYAYSTLQTNIDRKQINFIHSLKGATGLSDENGRLTFSNIRIGSSEQRIVSFDARLNYSEQDKSIATEPEFLTSDKHSVIKSLKKEIMAKKLSREEIKSRLEKRGVTIKNLKKK